MLGEISNIHVFGGFLFGKISCPVLLHKMNSPFEVLSERGVHLLLGTNLIHKKTRPYDINVREHRSGNQKWTIQRNWHHWVHNTQKNTTQYVPDTTMLFQLTSALNI